MLQSRSTLISNLGTWGQTWSEFWSYPRLTSKLLNTDLCMVISVCHYSGARLFDKRRPIWKKATPAHTSGHFCRACSEQVNQKSNLTILKPNCKWPRVAHILSCPVWLWLRPVRCVPHNLQLDFLKTANLPSCLHSINTSLSWCQSNKFTLKT